MYKRVMVLLISLAPLHPVLASCFKLDPTVPPSKELKAMVDYKQDGLMGFGESPVGKSNSSYPPKLTDDALKLNAGRRMGSSESGKVSYYEPAVGGGWRVCRIDLWVPSGDGDDHRAMAENSARYSAGNGFLEDLVKQNRSLAFSTAYTYDKKGRVERIEKADFSERPKVSFKAKHCRRYDEKDNVVLWVNPESTHKCPSGNPSLRDEWRQFKYAMSKGEQIELLSRWHIPKQNGEWKEQWTPFQLGTSPDAISGNANVDSRRGVWEIFGSNYGKLDNNSANMVVDEFGHWNGSNYYFPKPPVSMSILEAPDELYKHERRRVTRLDNHTRMVELFKANEHISRHRFYTLDGNVLRHEQLDDKGKVKRIITVNDWRQPRPGSNPDVNDKLLSTSAPLLAGRKIYHRVYEVAEGGLPKLVAVSWDPSARPFKDTAGPASRLMFGTPDGKVKWKSQEEFHQAFETSADARQVYPDKQDLEVGIGDD
jgi:hypothetical protein